MSALGGGALGAVITGGLIGGIFAKDGADQFWPGFGWGALAGLPLGFLIGGIAGKDKKAKNPKPSLQPDAQNTSQAFVPHIRLSRPALHPPRHHELRLSLIGTSGGRI